MKAIYQTPKIDIAAFSVSEMIASSLKVNNDNTITQELSTADETDATSGNLSRRGLWDDGEEEF